MSKSRATVSDPTEEEDLDDLDDVLEQFTPHSNSQSQSRPAVSASKSSAPKAAAAADDPDPEEDDLSDMPEVDQVFLQELTKNMEFMFANLSAPTATSTSGGNSSEAGLDTATESDVRRFFEEMMRNSAAGNGGSDEKEMQEAIAEIDATLKAASNSAGTSSEKPSGKGKSSTSTSSFQDKIRQTHEKMQASDQSARVSPASSLL